MILLRTLMLAMLFLGLLLQPDAAAESIQRFTDQQGTIHIIYTGPTGQEKTGEVKPPPPRQAVPAEEPAPESTTPHQIWWNGSWWVDEPAVPASESSPPYSENSLDCGVEEPA